MSPASGGGRCPPGPVRYKKCALAEARVALPTWRPARAHRRRRIFSRPGCLALAKQPRPQVSWTRCGLRERTPRKLDYAARPGSPATRSGSLVLRCVRPPACGGAPGPTMPRRIHGRSGRRACSHGSHGWLVQTSAGLAATQTTATTSHRNNRARYTTWSSDARTTFGKRSRAEEARVRILLCQ